MRKININSIRCIVSLGTIILLSSCFFGETSLENENKDNRCRSIDGFIDCNDPACADHEACRPETIREICTNGIDDNGNGLTDCEDPECADHEACRPENSCCETSETPGCNDYEIESCVCEKNPWCCEMKWDDICVQMVENLECGDCTCPCLSDCTLPECADNEACACDTPHAAPGCNSTMIQQCVCDHNTYCCEAEWDDICVQMVTNLGCI